MEKNKNGSATAVGLLNLAGKTPWCRREELSARWRLVMIICIRPLIVYVAVRKNISGSSESYLIRIRVNINND